jgi:hypothetical protein
MEAANHPSDHHEMPTSGQALTSVAFSATLHCLTGCAIGEIAGMAIGTWLGFSNGATIVLAIVLAFFFGYSLTSLPLLRAGLTLGAVIPVAFASDTLSIAVMEVVDNLIMVVIPGAMNAGLGDLLFWGSLSFALVVAGAVALPVNRWLIARGKGHAAVHRTGIHGGPPTRAVAAVAAVAGIFGTAVLVAQAVSASGGDHRGMTMGGHESMAAKPAAVRGLATSADGMTLALSRTELRRGRASELQFQIMGADGRPVREFEVEHEKRMHFIVVRRDLTGFQHLHPALRRDGVWRTKLAIPDPGSYRVFADFKQEGRSQTLAADLAVDGPVDWQSFPAQSQSADAGDGYEVHLAGEMATGRDSQLRFSVSRDGKPVTVEPYLGAGGHLVALREGDLAYLHVHPAGQAPTGRYGTASSRSIAFATEFPSRGRYVLFLQFKHDGRVHTARFARVVSWSPGPVEEMHQGGEHHGH